MDWLLTAFRSSPGLLFFLSFAAYAEVPPGSCEQQEKLTFTLETVDGNISIALFPSAAPIALKTLQGWIRGPIFNANLSRQSPSSVGFYDGLNFDYAKPRIEIRTSTRSPSGYFKFDSELNAESVGLDRLLIENVADAMEVLQRELVPFRNGLKKKGGVTEPAKSWLGAFAQTDTVDHLVGLSRKDINQALGYRYGDDIVSRAAVRGAVALVPDSPGSATARLSIMLTDFPRRTGRWMVIGEVVSGLDVAEKISLKPLFGPKGWKNGWYRPRIPTKIEKTQITCDPPAEEGGQ